jgi:hypothetical protein
MFTGVSVPLAHRCTVLVLIHGGIAHCFIIQRGTISHGEILAEAHAVGD